MNESIGCGMTNTQDEAKDQQKIFTVYASDDHFLIIDNMMDAETNRHKFLHLVISLEGGSDAGLHIEVDGAVLHCNGIIINSDVTHSFYGKNHKHAMLLVDHTSQLGRCMQNSLLQDNAAYNTFSDQLSVDLKQQIAKIPESKLTPLDYHEYWYYLLSLLSLKNCSLIKTTGDERVTNTLEYLTKSKKFNQSITALAKKSHLSPSRLSHLFKQHTGGTLKNYLLFRQLLSALSLIAEGNSATMAAVNSGFDTPSHLSATCKRLMGINPNLMSKVSSFLKVFMFH